MPLSTSLTLDARQRAMLAEMGIRLWQPGADATASDAAAAPRRGMANTRPAHTAAPATAAPGASPDHAAAPSLPPAARPPASTTTASSPTSAVVLQGVPADANSGPARVSSALASGAPVAPPTDTLDPSTLDWPALQALLAQDSWPSGQLRVLSGHGDAQASWLFINDAAASLPMPAATTHTPAAPTEQLLDNMLRACRLSRQAGAFMIYAHPLPDQVDHPGTLLRAWLEQVVKTLRPRVIVLMSRPATHSLLQTREAPGRLRGQVLSACGVPVVVSYPPALLLGKAENKRRAWADLCHARSIVG